MKAGMRRQRSIQSGDMQSNTVTSRQTDRYEAGKRQPKHGSQKQSVTRGKNISL